MVENPIISVRNVHKTFEGNYVLRGLSLDVFRGETLVILGRSGCGKSVLLKIMIGLMKPDEGEVIIDGVDITALDEPALNEIRRRFGVLFQSSALFDSMSVGENVAFPLRMHTTLSDEEIKRRVKEKLALVELHDVENLSPSQLSGGMMKRVALARAIAMDPEIIFYDEPTTGIDPITADAINELILSLARKLGVTSVLVTHDMKSAFKVGTRIVLLHKGQVVAEGRPDEFEVSDNPYVRQFIEGSSHGPLTGGEEDGESPGS